MAIMLLIGVLFFLIGFAILGYGIVFYFRQRQRQSQWQTAVGVVVNLVKESTDDGYVYCPQIQFQTNSGQVSNFQSDFGSRPASHRVGERIEVFYNPLDPSQAQINSFMTTGMMTAIFFLIGAVFTGLGLVVALVGAAVLLNS